jgi:hypothetical protein
MAIASSPTTKAVIHSDRALFGGRDGQSFLSLHDLEASMGR